jgi:ribosomal-protein-alanine N-acetyltransferase
MHRARLHGLETSRREGELPALRGEKVCLRWLTEADVDALFDIFSDPEVARYLAIPRHETRQDSERFLAVIHEGFRSSSLFQWGIEHAGRVIGTCTLGGLDWVNRRAEIGFSLRRASWGQGLMSGALALLIDHAFNDLGLHRIEADVDPRNSASLRILDRLGFQREGYLRERYLKDGEAQDSVIFGLLRNGYRRLPPSSSKPSPKRE